MFSHKQFDSRNSVITPPNCVYRIRRTQKDSEISVSTVHVFYTMLISGEQTHTHAKLNKTSILLVIHGYLLHATVDLYEPNHKRNCFLHMQKLKEQINYTVISAFFQNASEEAKGPN